MLEAYRQHVAEREAEGVVPKPLSAEQVTELVELLKQPPAGEEAFLTNLLENRVPAGVDDADRRDIDLSVSGRGRATACSLLKLSKVH